MAISKINEFQLHHYNRSLNEKRPVREWIDEVNGVHATNSNSKVIETVLSEVRSTVNEGIDKLAWLEEEAVVARADLDEHSGKISELENGVGNVSELKTVAKTNLVEAINEVREDALSVVYSCTGECDDVAISEYVNSFLNGVGEFEDSNARTLRLDIVGKVGFSDTPAYGTGVDEDEIRRYFNFQCAVNTDKRVYIDWGAATIPSMNFTVNDYKHSAMIYHSTNSTFYHDQLNIKYVIGSGSAHAIFNNIGRVYVCNSYCYGGVTDEGYGYGISNRHGELYVSDSYCYGYGIGGNGYGIQSQDNGTIYISNSRCFGSGTGGDYKCGVYNRDEGVIYISNSYCGSSNSSSNSNIYNQANGTIYVSNSYCYVWSGYNIYNNGSGTIYLSNSYCYARTNQAICNANGGMMYISNSCCYTEDGYFAVSNVGGTVRISNSCCRGGLNCIVNTTGTIYVTGLHCYDTQIGISNFGGTIYISNSHCSGGKGISNSGGTIYISNSYCVGINGHGISQSSAPGKLFITNCCLAGYQRDDIPGAGAYGLHIPTSNSGYIIVLKDCHFPKADISGQEQSGAVFFEIDTNTAAKYHISGNVFYSPTIRLPNGENATSIIASEGKYMPEFANMFNV